MDVVGNNETKNDKPKVKSIDKSHSLNNLNSNYEYTYDFEKEKSPEWVHGRLKTERGITKIIFSTMITVVLIMVGLVALAFVAVKVLSLDVRFFTKDTYYSLEYFNSELGRMLLTLFILLLLICIITSFVINLAVKIRFRKSYLSKSNVYVYDIFIAMWNALVYSFIAVVFFVIINNYDVVISGLMAEELIAPKANIDILNSYKYLIVVIVAVFIALNSIRGIAITYENNKFVFENHL